VRAPSLSESRISASFSICPFLVSETAALPRAALPAEGHRCAAAGVAAPISAQHQRVFCFTSQHRDCSRYLAVARQPLTSPARDAPRAAIASAAALMVAVVGAAAVALLAIGNPFTVEPLAGDATPPATAAALATAPAVATIEVTLAPVSPTRILAAPSATATPPASPRPSATPATYTVRPGDSLTAVAARFGVTVPALAAANGLAPTAQLRIAQTLVIPPPAAVGTVTPASR